MKPHGNFWWNAAPQSTNQDMYDIQDVIGERLEKGVPKYLSPKMIPWEPIEHLCGKEGVLRTARLINCTRDKLSLIAQREGQGERKL